MLAWFGSNVSVPPACVACWSSHLDRGRKGKAREGTRAAWQKDRRSSPLNGVHDGWH